MKKKELNATVRENLGKTETKKIREEGNVPGVLYGGEKEIHFTVKENDLNKVVFSPDVYQIQIMLNGSAHLTIIQDIQFHPVTDRVLHIDFLELAADRPVKVGLPLRFVGNSIGVRNGGKLVSNLRKLTVKGLPDALPEEIEVNIEKLRIGKSIKVKDIQINGLEILEAGELNLVAVKTARAVVEEEEEEETTAEGEEGAKAEGGEAAGEGGEKPTEAAKEPAEASS